MASMFLDRDRLQTDLSYVEIKYNVDYGPLLTKGKDTSMALFEESMSAMPQFVPGYSLCRDVPTNK